ncbi:U-box domain-containing protein 7 [Hordeum vulgare]|nr:U-box domain-containing protein 7 [Hordeum vulgare]
MATLSVSFNLLGASFGASAGWRGQEEERCYIHRKADGGSRRNGAAEFRRRPRVDEYVQDGGAVWHRGGINSRPGKVAASVPALKMGWWNTAATACAPDRFGPSHGSDIRHTFIMGIGVEACVAKMLASGLLMYCFLNGFSIFINNLTSFVRTPKALALNHIK